MIKTSIENMAEPIGFDIGNSDDITQSNLINGLCNGLANSMSEKNLEMQICYIVDKLNPNSFKVLRKLNEFIELKK